MSKHNTESIARNVKQELLKHIKDTMRKLDAFLCTGDKKLSAAVGHDVVIEGTDLRRKVKLDVEVDNSYLDVDDACTEPREVETIAIEYDDDEPCTDGWLCVELAGGAELYEHALSLNDLVLIGNTLDETYENAE